MGIGLQSMGLGSFNVSTSTAWDGWEVRLGDTWWGVSEEILMEIRWESMGYPMKKELKIKLVFLYYELLCKYLTVARDGNR